MFRVYREGRGSSRFVSLVYCKETRVVLKRIGLLLGFATLIGCGSSSTSIPDPEFTTVSQIREGLQSSDAGEADESAAVASPTGYATLRGQFTLQGSPPAPTVLSITKDAEVCAPGGKQVYAESLVVDPASNGIANVLLYADGMPADWVHPDAQPGKEDEVIFDQKECVFLTHVVAIQTSQKLRVLNSDPVGHNLMVASFNQTIPVGGYAIYEPLKEQRAPVEMRCSIHPWMQAWFINRDNGYFAVTNPDGSFEIPNLPAGVPIEIRVWQEKLGPVSEVLVNGEATTWSKGRLALTLEPDSELDLNVVLDASQFN
jgi:hypothetical protein